MANSKITAKRILKQLESDLKQSGKIVLTHNNIDTEIIGIKNCSIKFKQGNSEMSYDFCDFIVTFNRFDKYKLCCSQMLKDFLPEIYGNKPCRAMLFIKIVEKYLGGTITSSKPYYIH